MLGLALPTVAEAAGDRAGGRTTQARKMLAPTGSAHQLTAVPGSKNSKIEKERCQNSRKGACKYGDLDTGWMPFEDTDGTRVDHRAETIRFGFCRRSSEGNPDSGQSSHPAAFVHCSFAPVRRCVHVVVHRSDLGTVMTSETVPAQQPGALVDECRIRDRTVETQCLTTALWAKSF